MHTLPSWRKAHHLARFVLLWFALYLGVAIAAPLVQGQGLQLVCTATGSIKLVATGATDDAGAGGSAAGHSLECPLCAGPGAPPAAAGFGLAMLARPPFALPAQPATRVALHTAAPPPARGPPTDC